MTYSKYDIMVNELLSQDLSKLDLAIIEQTSARSSHKHPRGHSSSTMTKKASQVMSSERFNLYDPIVIEEGMMDKIKEMISKGISIATIATALSLPFATVQDAVAKTTKPIQTTQPQAKKQNTYSASLDVLAKTIYHEARGESFIGKKAVASTIYNRAQGKPSKMTKVVKTPKQYSCWNNGWLPKGKGEAWNESLLLAKNLLAGVFKPNTNNTHYYNPSIVNPKWAKGAPKERIGNHIFLTVEDVEDICNEA